MRKFLSFFFLIILFLFSLRQAEAQEFRDDYKVVYTVNQDNNEINTFVNFSLKVTNLLPDLYVKNFSLSFPKSFTISNLNAADDNGSIPAKTSESSSSTQITLEFRNPKVGQGTSNNFYLTFNQKNLFKINGNVWEVILPTIEGHRLGDYQVEINLPEDTSKKISIAKPKPDQIVNNTIYWKNPSSKTIYAVFGNTQLYGLNLIYNLHNPKLYRVYTDVAFPPDMLHQKIFVNSVNPSPSATFTDEDGNFIARYYLNPKENKKVFFKGVAALFVNSRPEIQLLNRVQIEKQKNYLLTQNFYWKVDQIDKYTTIKTPGQIYDFITDNFSYDYQRVSKDIKRLGAEAALQSPNKVVCTEFSDTFIALAREKGIFAREIEGYGFSGDSQLRPLSLITDVLHSWPEYYDGLKSEWISVDPTWENTSGIDYFNSFDIDHIAFAIHGKRADYPLPVGMYKQNDSKDVLVEAISTQPLENKELTANHVEINATIEEKKTYKGSFIIKNTGNVFQYNIPVVLQADNLKVTPSKFILDSIAPFEQKSISFSYGSGGLADNKTTNLIVTANGEQLYSKQINQIPFYYSWFIKSVIIIAILGTMILVFRRNYAGKT